jgi:anthranilate phosphoribosyltransferase
MAETLAAMPLRRAFVIHGADGWDEATPVGPFVCFDVSDGRVGRGVRDPAEAGLPRCTAAELAGGDPADNAARLRAALQGADTAAHRDALLAGAALALEVTGSAADFPTAVAAARRAIEDGAARRLLERLDAFASTEKARASGA